MTNLGKNIKKLRVDNKFNQSELAKILGVSQTSVAHYEAGTRHPSIETLVQLSQTFNKSIDDLVGHPFTVKQSINKTTNQAKLIDSLVKSLLSKNEDEFIKQFEENVYQAHKLYNIMDIILSKVMYKIGNLWEEGSITEADEHYATNIVRKINNYISIKYGYMIKNKKAITFSIASEQHTLGIEMVNTYLGTVGIESIYLGSNVSIKSIEKMITEYKPEFIFISITMSDNMNSLIHFIEYINERHPNRFKIGIGGQGYTDNEDLSNLDNLYILHNIKELKNLLTQ